MARNESAPTSLFSQLGRDPEPSVLAGVAAHPKTPHASLSKLAKNIDREVQLAVAHNPSTPPDALQHLAQSGTDEHIRLTAASHPNATAHIRAMAKLAE